jgi:hypothetical protein
MDEAQMCRECFDEHMRRAFPELPDGALERITVCLWLEEDFPQEAFEIWQLYQDPVGPTWRRLFVPMLQVALLFRQAPVGWPPMTDG